MPPLHTRPMDNPHRTSLSVDTRGCFAWGCCLRMRPHGEEGVSGGCDRRRGHGTAAEVVASVDVTVLTAVGDVAHVKICSLLAFRSRAPHFGTELFACICVLCPVLNFFKNFLWDTTGWTQDFFRRQSEEALLVKHGKLSSA